LNEAALRRTLSRARSKRHRRFETCMRKDHKLERPGVVAEWCIARYDVATVSLGFMVRSMNFDIKVASQVLFFPITSRLESIEIP